MRIFDAALTVAIGHVADLHFQRAPGRKRLFHSLISVLDVDVASHWHGCVLAASLAYRFGLEWGATRSRSFRFVVIDEAFGRGSDESARYGLELFRKLNLQLLIVTPLQKIHIIEPYVASVGFVHNEQGRESMLRCLSIEEYREQKFGRDDSHEPA